MRDLVSRLGGFDWKPLNAPNYAVAYLTSVSRWRFMVAQSALIVPETHNSYPPKFDILVVHPP